MAQTGRNHDLQMNGHKWHPVRRSGQPFIEAAPEKTKQRSSSCVRTQLQFLTFLALLFIVIVLTHHFLPSIYFISALRIMY